MYSYKVNPSHSIFFTYSVIFPPPFVLANTSVSLSYITPFIEPFFRVSCSVNLGPFFVTAILYRFRWHSHFSCDFQCMFLASLNVLQSASLVNLLNVSKFILPLLNFFPLHCSSPFLSSCCSHYELSPNTVVLPQRTPMFNFTDYIQLFC